MNTITATKLDAKLTSGDVSHSQILDVRTPIERREVHIAETSFLPLDALNVEDARRMTSQEPTFLLCRSGKRAATAAKKFHEEGGHDAIVIEGGILAWEQSGLAVVREKSVMSLERQVRVAAGSLVAIGTLLGITVHPSWHFLSGFVGAGLVFAGLTNTCAMGMLIAKMPWNRSHESCCSSQT